MGLCSLIMLFSNNKASDSEAVTIHWMSWIFRTKSLVFPLAWFFVK